MYNLKIKDLHRRGLFKGDIFPPSNFKVKIYMFCVTPALERRWRGGGIKHISIFYVLVKGYVFLSSLDLQPIVMI